MPSTVFYAVQGNGYRLLHFNTKAITALLEASDKIPFAFSGNLQATRDAVSVRAGES